MSPMMLQAIQQEARAAYDNLVPEARDLIPLETYVRHYVATFADEEADETGIIH